MPTTYCAPSDDHQAKRCSEHMSSRSIRAVWRPHYICRRFYGSVAEKFRVNAVRVANTDKPIKYESGSEFKPYLQEYYCFGR